MAYSRKRGNSYLLRQSCGYDMNGRQIVKSMTWKPAKGMTDKQIEKELQRQLVLFEEKCNSGQVLDGSIRLCDFCDIWMKDYAEKQLRPSTLSGYKGFLKRILPALGHLRMDKIQPHHLMAFYDNLMEKGIRLDNKYKCKEEYCQALRGVSRRESFAFRLSRLCSSLYPDSRLPVIDCTKAEFARLAGVSVGTLEAMTAGRNIAPESADNICRALHVPIDTLFIPVGNDDILSTKTVQHYHRLLSSIFNTAVKWQVIFSNPCSRTDPPKVERKEALYLDEHQAARLLGLLDDEPEQYRTMITLLIHTGMRRGELCGLEWSDIDFDKGIISIRRSSIYQPEKGVFTSDTKTPSSHRVLKLTPDALAILRTHRAEQGRVRLSLGDQWHDYDRLFTQWNGKPIYPDTLTSWFHKFVQRNNLPPVSIHSLRHTNATLLIAAGTNVRAVAAHLGHAQASTTMNIYSHAIQSAEAAAADALQSVLTQARKTDAG